MGQGARQFSQRLNDCLDDTQAPAQPRERANVLSRLLDIPKQQAWSILQGLHLPDTELLTRIATEFEVDPQWLCGDK